MISLTVAAAVMSATLSSADVPAPPIGQQVRDGDPQQAAIEVAMGDNGFRRAVPPKPVAEDVDDVHARPMEVYALNPPADAPQRLADLLATPKFASDGMVYTGVLDPGARATAEATVNAAIAEVQNLLRAPTDNAAVLRVFRTALQRLDLSDTEDRARAATYFEEIMECIGLESSEGLLNEFVYGFDPSDLTL